MMARSGIEAAIQAIADKNGGRVTASQVVTAARNKDSALHSWFTWNIKEAAEERWLEQARALIRSVRVEVTTTHFTVQAPAYVRDPTVDPRLQGFASLARLRTDDDASREAVVNEFARASAALARAKHVAVALGLSDEIEEVRGRVLQLSERALQEGTSVTASA